MEETYLKNIQLVVGSCFLFIILVCALFGSHLPLIDESLSEETMRMTDDKILIPPYPPSFSNPLGSDTKGRDMLSLLVLGTRETILMVLAVVVLRYLIAIPLGLAANYSRVISSFLSGWNQMLSFIPPIFLVALFLGIPVIYYSANLPIWFIIILAGIELGRLATLIKESVKHLSNELFIQSAITVGTKPLQLFMKHLFPHLRIQLITNFVNDLARVLFLLSQLAVIEMFVNRKFTSQEDGSYVSENISISYPMFLQDVTRNIWSNHWIPLYTILFISFMIITFLLLGDGLKKHYLRKYS